MIIYRLAKRFIVTSLVLELQRLKLTNLKLQHKEEGTNGNTKKKGVRSDCDLWVSF